MKLRIESNIKLQEELKCNDWNKIQKCANKISLIMNHVVVSVIKDRGCESDYIYEVEYTKGKINLIEQPTDKQRISQLEQEVAELKGQQKQQEYFIWDFSHVTNYITGEQLWWGMPMTKECPFYTIAFHQNNGYVVLLNTETKMLYNAPLASLKYKEDYVGWRSMKARLKTFQSFNM